MKTRPKILNNIGLKLFAFAFAFILWLLVTNYNDPVIETRIYDVPVQLLHTDLILGSDCKLVEDYKGNKLLLFGAFWSIKWVSDHNPQLVLTEFNEKNQEDDG